MFRSAIVTMAERNIVRNLNAKATDGNTVFTPKQWLERFRQFSNGGTRNRHYTIDKRRRNNTKHLDRKRTSNTRRFYMGSWTGSPIPDNASRIKNVPDTKKIKDLIRLFTEYYMPKTNTYHNLGRFFWAKQTEEEIPEEFWRRLYEIEKECNFKTISAEELLISNYRTAITEKSYGTK